LTAHDLELLKKQAELVEAQANAQSAQYVCLQEGMRLRPSLMYPCKIFHNDVTWVCQYAYDENAVGCGDTPSAAQAAFDAMWLGDPDVGMDG